MPVLIKQVHNAPENNITLFGINYTIVQCAVIVRSIDVSSTKITYELEDHTGRIQANYWLEEGDTFKSPDVMINNYAMVFGSIRRNGDVKSLMLFKVMPITDPNEVCTHLLEVLNARYMAEKLQQVNKYIS